MQVTTRTGKRDSLLAILLVMITVIIPTRNEAVNLERLLACLGRSSVEREIIVVDASDDESTRRIAEAAGIACLSSAPGRGGQLAAGARESRGDILFLLHADTVFEDDPLASIESRLKNDLSIAGGNFALRFDGSRPFDRFAEWLCRAARPFGVYYGDSGIFVRKEAYERLGGIKPLPIMEDYDFVRRLERRYRTCHITDMKLTTSSRKFQGKSPVAIVFLWIRMHVLFALGSSPERLRRAYYGDT